MNKIEEEMVRLNPNKKRVVKRIFDCYREMYRLATPSVDFDKLCETDEVKKEFWFNKYYLDENTQQELMKKYKKNLRENDRKVFDFEVYLGSSPSYLKE
jgi:histidinol phosphatase-like PHP family hydrolase